MWRVKDGDNPIAASKICKKAIIEASVDASAEIKKQSEAIAKQAKEDAAREYSQRYEKAMAEEKQVWAKATEQKLKTARQQGHEQGCKDASSLMQQLEDSNKAKAVAQKALAEKQDPFEGKHPDKFVLQKLGEKGMEGKTTRTKDGVYYEDGGGAILIRCRKTAFQTAWIKEIKQAMQEPFANYAIIVSCCLPGPRQLKEIKEAKRAGVWVCAPGNFDVVAEMVWEWMDKGKKQALVQSVKDDVKGELYDFVVSGEMQTLQSMLHDSLKAKAKAIKGLENQIAHLKAAMDKEVEVSNQVFTKMLSKAGVKALPESK